MKIARLSYDNSETYGFVNGDKVATKDEITYQTGVPIPQSIKDFLFDGWYEEIKDKIKDLKDKKILRHRKIPHCLIDELFINCYIFYHHSILTIGIFYV